MSLKEIGLGNYSELILHSLSEVVSFGQGCGKGEGGERCIRAPLEGNFRVEILKKVHGA